MRSTLQKLLAQLSDLAGAVPSVEVLHDAVSDRQGFVRFARPHSMATLVSVRYSVEAPTDGGDFVFHLSLHGSDAMPLMETMLVAAHNGEQFGAFLTHCQRELAAATRV